MHILILALILIWLAWPLGLAFVGLLLLYANKKAWKRRRRADRIPPRAASTGSTAFDEYREEALRRLEEERGKFADFLERLRKSRDKEAFDRFMAERRGGQRAIENGAA